MAYLHGVETVDIQTGSRPVQVVRSAIIGLVGISPSGPKNQITLVTSERDAAQFGLQVPGFTIPQSLDAIFSQGAGAVLVINVFDAATHTTEVAAESKTVTNGKLKLTSAPIGAVTITDAAGAAVTYIKGTDYQIDDYGNFTVLSSQIANGTVLKFTYKKLNVSAVDGAAIVGSYAAGVRTGMKLFDAAYNLFGFNPKILIAPGFSTLAVVAAAMITAAKQFRAITYLDAPAGTTVADAIAGRGPAGTINFNTSDKRVELLYPQLKKYDPATGQYVNFAYSAFKAGVRAAVDNADGFWFSDSNREIKGTTGAEVDISAGLSDQNSDANNLNAAGITTVFNSFGSGLRTWGNRNASFPTNAGADSFNNIVRLKDIVSESLEYAALQFLDQPVTQAWIDSVRETANAFIRVLIARGALIPGSEFKFNKADNPVTELAAGHVTFEMVIMGPTPAERITFNTVLDINLLSNLV